ASATVSACALSARVWMTTSHPERAKRSAVARPIFRPAPVIKAFLLCMLIGLVPRGSRATSRSLSTMTPTSYDLMDCKTIVDRASRADTIPHHAPYRVHCADRQCRRQLCLDRRGSRRGG